MWAIVHRARGRARMLAIIVRSFVRRATRVDVGLEIARVDAPPGPEANRRQPVFPNQAPHEFLPGAQAMSHMRHLEEMRHREGHRNQQRVERHQGAEQDRPILSELSAPELSAIRHSSVLLAAPGRCGPVESPAHSEGSPRVPPPLFGPSAPRSVLRCGARRPRRQTPAARC